MDVAIIGTGNVATILGKLLRLNGIKINGVIGRNTEATKENFNNDWCIVFYLIGTIQ